MIYTVRKLLMIEFIHTCFKIHPWFSAHFPPPMWNFLYTTCYTDRLEIVCIVFCVCEYVCAEYICPHAVPILKLHTGIVGVFGKIQRYICLVIMTILITLKNKEQMIWALY